MAFKSKDIVAIASHGLFVSTDASLNPAITSISPTSGTLGDIVTIVGTNFGTAGLASLGGSPLAEISYADTKIRARIAYNLSGGLKDLAVYNNTTERTGIKEDAFTFDSAEDSTVRTALRQAVKFGIEQITIANGYRTKVKMVNDPWVPDNKMQEFPNVNLYWGREERLGSRIAGNNPLLDMRMTCTISCHLASTNDPVTRQDKMLADVQQYFGNNFYIPDSSGNRTIFNCVYLSSEPWGGDPNKPTCGIDIELEIFYRINLKNPDSMV